MADVDRCECRLVSGTFEIVLCWCAIVILEMQCLGCVQKIEIGCGEEQGDLISSLPRDQE